LFGFSIDGDGPIENIIQIIQAILFGKTNVSTLLIGLGTLIIILALKRFKRIPSILLAVIAATVVVGWLQLDQTAGVKVLGTLPKGLPEFSIPWIALADAQAIIIGGFAVAMVSFADTSVLSRVYAVKTQSYVDPNQEMIGLGAANLATGFFQGFPISSSSSRTPVAEVSGAKSQLTGVVGAVAVALLLIYGNELLRNLPTSALAAVVITSAVGLFEWKDLHRIYRIQQWEFWLSILCFAGVAVFGAIEGIGIAVLIALIEFLWDAWRPHFAVLGRVDGVRGYHDIIRYPDARLVPGLVLFRWDAPLFFANAEQFKKCILQAVNDSPVPVKRIIVAAEPVTGVDVTSADIVDELYQTLAEAQIELHFAEMKDPVKDKFKRFELFNRLGTGIFHPTVGAAVDAYLEQHNIDWKP
jgi:MFS superfamily sulfate permease-like transporter